MALGTRRGVGVVPVVILIAMIWLFGSKIADLAGSALPDIGSSTNGDYAAGPDARSLVTQCTTDQVLKTKRCNDVKILIMDANRMPFIARNIQLGWREGKPSLLNRDSSSREANYTEVCRKRFVLRYPGKGSCDETPFASTQQGGLGARTAEVPRREQACQGGTISRAYQDRPIAEGEQFVVVISNPGKIATRPYEGRDIAEDRTCQA